MSVEKPADSTRTIKFALTPDAFTCRVKRGKNGDRLLYLPLEWCALVDAQRECKIKRELFREVTRISLRKELQQMSTSAGTTALEHAFRAGQMVFFLRFQDGSGDQLLRRGARNHKATSQGGAKKSLLHKGFWPSRQARLEVMKQADPKLSKEEIIRRMMKEDSENREKRSADTYRRNLTVRKK